MPEDVAYLSASPRFFGRYEVVRTIGRGAMGELFEGRHVDLGTRVAIKVMHADGEFDHDAARRILREGRATAAIRHPHVVSVLDVGEESGRPFLVMELLEGEDLAQSLAKRGPLPVEQAADLLLPITSAVAAGHDAGVIHRDLKPSNIFLAWRGGRVEPVVVDFGISKALEPSADKVSSQRMAGTPHYMAPERFRAPHDATALSDQYALGILLYECLTGGTPFETEHYYDLLQSIMTEPVVAPSAMRPDLPAALDAVTLRAVARDPTARFPNVRAFGAALLPFASAHARRTWEAELLPASDVGLVPTLRPPKKAGFLHRLSGKTMGTLGLACAVAAAAVVAVRAYVRHDASSAGRTLVSPSPQAPLPEERPVSAPELSASPAASASAVTGNEAPAEAPRPAAAPTDAQGHAGRVRASSARAAAAPQSTSKPAPSAPAVSAASANPPAGAPLERGSHNIPIVE
jgi:serine/threonine-protein kinase